ncbi:TPA: hypothetical protein IAA87_01985 [Candidatus Avigastranaerophilus faecigallinarum]|nr:hypothetical protein [Candidatus Avigastranaerophilus faecigallinarum]
MKINYIKTIGFRKNKETFETNLYDITSITGGNTKGKTNILYAIIWGFLGTNLTGDEKEWLGNKNSDDCLVELHFTDNFNIPHILVRYKNKYDNSKNFIMLDGKTATQKDIQSFYGDKKLFLSILNPNYFISKKPAEQKELLDKYLPEIDISIVYDKLDNTEKALLESCPKNILEFISELNENKRITETKIGNLQGKIEYAQNIINSTVIEEEKTFEKAEELKFARMELSSLEAENTFTKTRQENIVNDLNNQIVNKESQIQDLTTNMKAGKQKYLQLKAEPVSYCPTCKQVLNPEGKLITINNMRTELEIAFESKQKLDIELMDLKSKHATERCKLHALESKSNLEREKHIEELRSQIQELEQEQLEIERFNSSILSQKHTIDGAENDISLFSSQIMECSKLLENIKETKDVAQKLYINYIEEKMKFATKHLKNVSIKYYKVSKEDGVIKEDFIILYNGNELKSISRSETIATSLELCNMLNIVAKTNFPLFIDDSESCADYNFIEDYSNGTQILIARVEKGKDLTISDYKSSEAMQVAA